MTPMSFDPASQAKCPVSLVLSRSAMAVHKSAQFRLRYYGATTEVDGSQFARFDQRIKGCASYP